MFQVGGDPGQHIQGGGGYTVPIPGQGAQGNGGAVFNGVELVTAGVVCLTSWAQRLHSTGLLASGGPRPEVMVGGITRFPNSSVSDC